MADAQAAMPSASLPALTNTYGAVLISSFLGLGLYGLTGSQIFRYYRLFPKDFAFHKALVPTLFLADTFHTVTLIHICYHYLINNYYNPLALLQAEWSIQGIVLLICQMFYARRIWLVDRRYRWVIGMVMVMILFEAGTILSATYFAFRATLFEDFIPHTYLNSLSFGVATATDLTLMVLFGIILRGSKTSFKDTRRGLDALAVYAAVATLLNTALTIPALIASIVSRETFIYMALSIPTVKIYSNGVLMFLNLRTSLAESVSVLRSDRTPSFSMSNLKRRGGRSNGAGDVSRQSPSVMIDIKMTTAVHEERDIDTMGSMGGVKDSESDRGLRREDPEAKHESFV
ncbi:hypothetical protein L226DRAFT_575195 [Lentinus tigrinus ALCF2SS1-7]|uniref:DUF6534 domain-containing protein n=1 Tax=Lentinus tigrinus ALCF2SS1-6 TaxID=1328759 RepID=A0A5C2RU25_9APHY|nr:hypothetical protein L227DRAFT_615867 [Lentinus tigrinus ALCF2SS1-6]RPD69900.1 hypothetical protein L226DRAFT_575195 [Lentinus tigrinus ALCF2SS1-7]